MDPKGSMVQSIGLDIFKAQSGGSGSKWKSLMWRAMEIFNFKNRFYTVKWNAENMNKYICVCML
jgi:hypothetical protein